jgi:peptidoglycan-associated lipoprotein
LYARATFAVEWKFQEAMFMLRKRAIHLGLALSLVIFAAGCKKRAPVAAAPPPPGPTQPPPPPPAPRPPVIDQFTAEPSSIQRGESSTLRWQVSGDATNISINNGVGAVQSAGSRNVTPSNSTTYTLTATGPGGSVTGVTTVSITSPPPPPPPPPPTAGGGIGTLEGRLGSLQDAYFDYDKNDIRADARDALSNDATALKSILADFPNASIVLEGHCDERGSAEYNLGLGDRRASAAKDYLIQLGVPGDHIHTISYGKERPVCTESNEDCWQKNRRAHFAPGQ